MVQVDTRPDGSATGDRGRLNGNGSRWARKKPPPVDSCQELFQLGVYKRNQGRIARQVTFATLAVDSCSLVGLYTFGLRCLIGAFDGRRPVWRSYAFPAWCCWRGLWVSYRIVNFPRFADFLDRCRSRDEQGFLAVARRIVSEFGRGDLCDFLPGWVVCLGSICSGGLCSRLTF